MRPKNDGHPRMIVSDAAPSSKVPAASLAAVAALGIVYGDLGTSPLYTMQTILSSLGERSPVESALGVLSLIVWTLVITVSVKYCLLVMRADNRGEGGILALMSLVGKNHWRKGTFIGASMGLLGAALIYGDGVITPSISVLSALEGVNVVTAALKPYILPAALVILIALFAAQRFGTASIGKAFGPIMLLWFFVIGVLGLVGVIHHPTVLRAIDPVYAIRLISVSRPTVFLLLGGVFLCATGGEALYADMGHIGRFPIRLAWYAIVLPSLLLSYAGQTGLLLDGIRSGANPFFLLTPNWGVVPMVVLATVATIIASQAIITGSFSMTRQAMQLGWLPGFDIRQTSDKIYGQIYVPAVNLMMAIGTIVITLAFRSSDKLAGAYGTAVSTTMVLTTLLLFRAMHSIWRWPLIFVVPIAGLFLAVDVSFFAANLTKVVDGGWAPLTLGLIIFVIMVTWRTGVQAVRDKLADLSQPAGGFLTEMADRHIARLPGTAVFLTRAGGEIPAFVAQYARYMGALHATVIVLNVSFQETPRVEADKRWTVEPIAEGFWRVTLRYGFVEVPDLSAALKQITGLPERVDPEKTVFFGARDVVYPGRHSALSKWRLALFAYLYKNSVRLSDRLHIPPGRFVEVARKLRI